MSLSASASPQRIYDYATTPYYVNLADKGESAPGDADTYRYVVCSPKQHQPTYLNVVSFVFKPVSVVVLFLKFFSLNLRNILL